MSVNQVSIGSDNGLSPIRHQAIIWNIAWLLFIGPLGTNVSEISIKISNFSFTKKHLQISSAKWRPFCPRGDALNTTVHAAVYHMVDSHWSYSVAITEYWGLPVCLSPEAFVCLSLPPCMSGLTPGPHFAHLGPSLPHRSSSGVCRLRPYWLWCFGGDKLLQSSHCCCQLVFENYLNHWKLGLTRMAILSSLVMLEAVTMTIAVPTSDDKVANETTFSFTNYTVHPKNQAHNSPLHYVLLWLGNGRFCTHIFQGCFTGNLMIAPIPEKHLWRIWVRNSNEFIKNWL